MKSYAVDSIYAFIIIVAVFLVLPFFVPMQEEEFVSEPVGEYTIEEEKPEIFTRIIDRVSSFYHLKKKKKAVLSKSFSEDKSADKKGELSSLNANSAEGAAQAGASNERMSADSVRTQRSQSEGTAGRYNAKQRSLPDMAELDGKVYQIMPDPYGNKYVIAKGGPIPLKDFIAKGGRIVKPSFNYETGNNLSVNMAGGNIRSAENGPSGRYVGSSGGRAGGDISAYKGRRGGKISGFNQGKVTDVGEESSSGSQGGSRGISSGFDLSGFDFGSGESFGELQQNLVAKSGGGAKSANTDDRDNRPSKVYKLQNTKPFVSENAVGVAIQKEDEGITIDMSGGGETDEFGFADTSGFESDFDSQTPQDDGNVLLLNIEAGYENSLGIIPENSETRKAMTRELLGDSSFIGKSSQGRVSDPWILPNNIDNGPGKEFFEANRDVLLGSDAVSFKEWEENDIYYNKVRGDIESTTNGAVTPLVMINGQKGPFTMQVMPENSYYYKVTSNLLNNKVRKVDEGGEVDLNRIDKNRVLVVVPERPLADNLRKDGYKVAIFDKYIVTPGNLKNFYDQTSNAIKDIEEGKKADHEAKKQDIARSLKK